MTQERKQFQRLESETICRIYNSLYEKGLIDFPLTQSAPERLDAIVANINGSNFDIPNYKTSEEKAIAYLYFIIKSHVFTDGNKRTAVMTFVRVCRANNLSLRISPTILDELAIWIVSRRDNHQDLIYKLSRRIF